MADLHHEVATTLYTTQHRNTKIAGQVPPATNLEGTGSVRVTARQHVQQGSKSRAVAADTWWVVRIHFPQCFDMTVPSEQRAGAHQPLAVEGRDLPRWSKATMQYK
jgi:hypothetical protein